MSLLIFNIDDGHFGSSHSVCCRSDGYIYVRKYVGRFFRTGFFGSRSQYTAGSPCSGTRRTVRYTRISSGCRNIIGKPDNTGAFRTGIRRGYGTGSGR